MNLLSVNVLVYAYRQDSSEHSQYRTGLLELIGLLIEAMNGRLEVIKQ